MIFLQLFYEFFKVGLFAIGGGLATLPFLYNISDRLGWFSHIELANMLAVSESTPGPIGVNTATYVGFTTAGLPGAITATLGLITPSVIIIVIVARILTRFRDNPLIASTFYGLRPASVGLIAAAGFSVMRTSLFVAPAVPAATVVPEQTAGGITLALYAIPSFSIQWLSLLVAVGLFFAMKKWNKLHPIVFIAVGAAAGILLHLG